MKMVSIAVALVALMFGACGGSDEADDPGEQGNDAASVEDDASSTTPDASTDGSATDPELLVSVSDFHFNPDTLALTAGQPTELPFVNNDPAPHNLSIYASKKGKSLFTGKEVAGTERVTYRIPSLEAGRYSFICDIHPTMKGTVEVK